MTRKRTRSADGNGTIRKRKDGSWEGRFTTGRDPGTGKQIQKSIYGKTQGEVAKKMRQKLASLDTGTYIEKKTYPYPIGWNVARGLHAQFEAQNP